MMTRNDQVLKSRHQKRKRHKGGRLDGGGKCGQGGREMEGDQAYDPMNTKLLHIWVTGKMK
eukprot:2482929-Pleurochrysis_carterae.AAC.1